MPSLGPRRAKVLVALVVVLAAAAVLIWLGVGRGSVYYYSVSEFRAVTSERAVRVSGQLNGGTLIRGDGTRFSFVIRDRENPGDTLQVVYDGALPDTFKDADGSEVILEGTRADGGVFQAQTFIAKCPSKYEAAE